MCRRCDLGLDSNCSRDRMNGKASRLCCLIRYLTRSVGCASATSPVDCTATRQREHYAHRRGDAASTHKPRSDPKSDKRKPTRKRARARKRATSTYEPPTTSTGAGSAASKPPLARTEDA